VFHTNVSTPINIKVSALGKNSRILGNKSKLSEEITLMKAYAKLILL
jgi:hypothetical protein